MLIPDVRKRLFELATVHGLPELEELAGHLKRRKAIGRAPAKSRPMTRRLAERIREHAATYPNDTQADIAAHFNVNPGRVSEALAGKRQ